MSLEQRLQHAGRELRGLPIDVPPLGAPRTDTTTHPRRSLRVLQALAAPMLFVAGGLFAYGAVQGESVSPSHGDVPTAPVTGDSTTDPWHAGDGPPPINRVIDRSRSATGTHTLSAPSAIVEQAIVARLLDGHPATPSSTDSVVTDSMSEQVVELRYVPV